MPDCGHPGASCVVGNFWTCPRRGCSNGPDSTEPEPEAERRRSKRDTEPLWFREFGNTWIIDVP